MLIIGEAFWDQFEDGSVLLGGSALNVAWNLQGLGGESYFVTRVGDDKLGNKLVFEMQAWGMDTHGVQVDQKRSTGVIKVVMDANKKPTFISPKEVAFDHIAYEDSLDILPNDIMMYHGSFALRNEASRSTIQKLKAKGHPVFMDLNLRSPYWSPQLVDEWANDVEILKLSDDEFLQLKSKIRDTKEQVAWLQKWMERKNIQNVLFTLGENGAYWISKTGLFFAEPQEETQVVSTVGAGDAFCAGVLFSRGLGLSSKETLETSAKFATEICKIKGATSSGMDFYAKCREEIWQNNFTPLR